MLKKFSVLIFAAIQILFCISLTAIEPTKEWLIENKGTVYHLKVSSVSFANYSDNAVNFTSCIECDWSNIYDYVHYQVLKGEYAIIETDANGISHLSARTTRKPKEGNYVKGYFPIRHLGWYVDTEVTEAVKEKLNELGINQKHDWDTYHEYEGTHDITYDVKVYKGMYQVVGMSIDGDAIEDVINN